MRLLLIILLSLFASSAFASDLAMARNAERVFREAEGLAEQGVHHEAIDAYYRAISMAKDYRYYVGLGHSQKAIKQEKLAFFSFRNALELLPKEHIERPAILVLIVTTALNLGRVKDLKTYLPELEEVEPTLAKLSRYRLYCWQGAKALKEKRFKEAYRWFKRARPYNLNDGQAIGGCCEALLKLNKIYKKEQKHKKRLHVLLLYSRLRPSQTLNERISEVFQQAGRPRRYLQAIRELRARP